MISISAKGIRRDMPPHQGSNEAFKVSPVSSDGVEHKPLSKRGLLQSGLKTGLQTGLNMKQKLEAGANMLLHRSEHNHNDTSKEDHFYDSKRSKAGAAKSYSRDQVVWYKAEGKKPKKAMILSIDLGPYGEAFYTIKFLNSDREKQTDGAHLEPLKPGDSVESDIQSRFKPDQIVFHKPNDGAPIYLAQITRVYQGSDEPLYEITLQGSNVHKSSIKESDLFDMHEVPGVAAPASSPSNHSRKSSRRSRSPKRGIKKVLSSEGLREIKRGMKKASSMDGLEKMRKAVTGVARDISRENPLKASLLRATPLKSKSGLSTASGANEELSKTSSNHSIVSHEQRPRNARVKQTSSMEGLQQMSSSTRPKKTSSMEGLQQMKASTSNGSLDGVRVRRAGVKKTRSMEGMMEKSKNTHPPPTNRAPAPNQSMMSVNSQHSQNHSVRSHRPQLRSQAEKNKLDRERGVQRSKSLEGMHPKNLRRPMSRERLPGGPPAMPSKGIQQNHSWHKEPGDRPRPPVHTASAGQRGAALQDANLRPQMRGTGINGIPTRNGSTESKRKSPRSQASLRRPVAPPAAVTPPIRAVKKPVYDSDSEESSISSVSFQEPKNRSFGCSQFPSKKEAPKPTEITVDIDDASSVSSGDSSWESFRERPSKVKHGKMPRPRPQKPKPKPVTHDTDIIGFDSVAGIEIIVQNVYSSDEDESSVELEFEPEDLFEWVSTD